MSDNSFSKDKFRRPEVFLGELLRKGAQGSFLERDENVPFLFRAVVAAVDVEGGKLENPDGAGSVKHTLDGNDFDVPANVGPSNPKNSLKARVISDGFDQFFHDDHLRVFWPFFPEHVALPVKPGEHVYVMFEDQDFQHGLWVSKVAGHEDVNYFRGQDSYKKQTSLSSKFGDSPEESSLNTDADAGEAKPDGRLAKLFGD